MPSMRNSLRVVLYSDPAVLPMGITASERRNTREMSDYEIHRPEPADFSPLDPTDTDVFTFDWSVRGYASDTILYAYVLSIPGGINFVGPPFIDGMAVQVMIGPLATSPVLPAVYLLRCTAVFASGRVSNYSIPFQVKTL